MSEIVATVIAGDPTDEELTAVVTGDPTEEDLAAVLAALHLARRRAGPAANGSRWARAGRLEAVGAAHADPATGLTGWAAAERPR